MPLLFGRLTGFSYSLDRGNKDLTEFFPALTHTIHVEHAQGQFCFMGCRNGISLWLTVLFCHTQKEPSSRGTATTTLFSTKAETRVELAWELDKERLSICILCRLYKLIASAEAWRWISWSVMFGMYRCTQMYKSSRTTFVMPVFILSFLPGDTKILVY